VLAVTREELGLAIKRVSRDDAQRLMGCYDALRICTLGDLGLLGLREAQGRRRVVLSGLRLMAALEVLEVADGASCEARKIAGVAVLDLRRVLAAYDEAIQRGLARLAAQGLGGVP